MLMASVLPVASSTAQPSKAARRRIRQRRKAILEAQLDSVRISEYLHGRRSAEHTTCEFEASLQRLEMKVDSVLEFLCRPSCFGNCVASSPTTDFGVPAEQLRKQCNAALAIQRAWKHRPMLLSSKVPCDLEDSRRTSATGVLVQPGTADLMRKPHAAGESDCFGVSECSTSAYLWSKQHVEREITVDFASPWHFLLLNSWAHASVTCKTAWRSIAEWTAIGDQYLANGEDDTKHFSRTSKSHVSGGGDCYLQSYTSEGSLGDGVIAVRWRGDSLCMDNVVEFFGRFGGCEPLDWSNANGENRVPLHFRDHRAAAAIRSCLTYTVRDDRGKEINVSIE